MNALKTTTSFIFVVGLLTSLGCELPEDNSSTWYVESSLPLQQQLGVSGIAYVSSPFKNELIAVGGYSKVYEFSNSEWNPAVLPVFSNSSLTQAIGVNGQGHVLVVGRSPNLFYFKSNDTWKTVAPVPLVKANFVGVWGNTDPVSDEFFVVGNSDVEGPVVYRVTKEATIWTREDFCQFKNTIINGVYGLGSGKFQQLYFVGDNATIISKENGVYTKIDPKILPIAETLSLKAVWISEQEDHPVYVVGRFGTILKYENNVWTKETLPEHYGHFPTKRLSFYAIDGIKDEILVVGANGTIFRKIKNTWYAEAEGMARENLISITHTIDPYLFYKTSFYVGGDLGTIFRSN